MMMIGHKDANFQIMGFLCSFVFEWWKKTKESLTTTDKLELSLVVSLAYLKHIKVLRRFTYLIHEGEGLYSKYRRKTTMQTTKSIQMDTFYGLNKYLHTHTFQNTLLHAHIRETRDMPKSTKINPHDFPFLIRWSIYSMST